jgi:hypothetical protein
MIHAWPDQAIVQALKIGQEVPWVLVGTATTDSSGKYSISMPVAMLAPEATGGVVNLEADSIAGSYSFPVVVTKHAGNGFLAASDPTVNISSSPAKFTCLGSWQYYGSLGKHWATVGQTYVPTNHATQQFTYSTGQFSSIGVGTSASGGKGKFSADGTMAWSDSHASSTKGSWPTYKSGRSVFYRTEFHFGEYICNHIGIRKGFEQHVNGYFGGGHIEKPPSVPRTHKWNCASYVPGFKFVLDYSNAVTWERSFGIHAGLSFDASVETGYDTDGALTYIISRERNICGTEGPPGGTPRQLVVRQ